MWKKALLGCCAGVILFLFGLAAAVFIQSRDQLEITESESFEKIKTFEIGNLTCIDVETAGRGKYDYQGYNARSGSALRPPYDVYTVTTSAGVFRITDHGVGNRKLQINGKIYDIGIDEHLRIDKAGIITLEKGGSTQIPEFEPPD